MYKINIITDSGTLIPLEVVVPCKNIHRPPSQSKQYFKNLKMSRNKERWAHDITQEDVDTLPLILVGLNYSNLFPTPLPTEIFGKVMKTKYPNMSFYKSIFTKNTLAAGVKNLGSSYSESINLIYHYQEIQSDPPIFFKCTNQC